MARYYRRRYTRVVKPKKKWATNFRRIVFDKKEIAVINAGVALPLCVNSVETDNGRGLLVVTPTPTIIKTGNFKIQCDSHVGVTDSHVIRTMLYIMYIPEGVFAPSTTGTDSQKLMQDYESLSLIVSRHPEWILAWRQFSSDLIAGNANLDKVSLSSRLKRNLNSGDKICAVFLVSVDEEVVLTSPITRVLLNGTCQFWTCNS